MLWGMEKRPEMDEEDEDDEDVIELWSPWKNKLLSCWSENTTDVDCTVEIIFK